MHFRLLHIGAVEIWFDLNVLNIGLQLACAILGFSCENLSLFKFLTVLFRPEMPKLTWVCCSHIVVVHRSAVCV